MNVPALGLSVRSVLDQPPCSIKMLWTLALGQTPGKYVPEGHPKLLVHECTKAGCEAEHMETVIVRLSQ